MKYLNFSAKNEFGIIVKYLFWTFFGAKIQISENFWILKIHNIRLLFGKPKLTSNKHGLLGLKLDFWKKKMSDTLGPKMHFWHSVYLSYQNLRYDDKESNDVLEASPMD